VLGWIRGRVYFPVHSNDLKSVAGCLGFRGSSPIASGLQAIVWRHRWLATGEEALKQQLLSYNQDDCTARAADCTTVTNGHGCTKPGGAACLPGDTNCTCTSFTFASCEDKGPTATRIIPAD